MTKHDVLPVNYITEEKNKKLIIERSGLNKIFFKEVKKNNFSKIINEIKEMALEDAKISIANFSILECFENPEKILKKLNEIVFYSYNIYEETRYDNVSTELFQKNMLAGISHVSIKYLKENEEKLIYRLKSKNII